MKISQLNIYPIKSLRGISVPKASLCAQGLEADRGYILLKLRDDGTYSNMWVGGEPEMALFHCNQASSASSFTVAYRIPRIPVTPLHPLQQATIEIPFAPVLLGLNQIPISLHTKPDYPAFVMPSEYNEWFSGCFGYQVVLAYIGAGLKQPGDQKEDQYWVSQMVPIVPTSLHTVRLSDNGALLVTSETSVEDLHPRLADGAKVLHEKFRPNIVVEGASAPWEEDFWAELVVPSSGIRILLTSNCARCIAINVDLDSGRMGDRESGKLLKKMMRDRRVDKGQKWTPIFGRYGFPVSSGEINVGDEIVVSRSNAERTTWNGYAPRLASFEEAVS